MSLFSDILLCKFVLIKRTDGATFVARPDMSTDIVIAGRSAQVIRFIPIDKRQNITYLLESDIESYEELDETQLTEHGVSASDVLVTQPNKKPFYEMPIDEQKFELMLASRNLAKTHRF